MSRMWPSALKRRVALLTVVVAAAGLLGFIGVVSDRGSKTAGLAPSDTSTDLFLRATPVDSPVWAGLSNFPVRGTKPVRLTSAEVLGVPPGMEIMGIWAIKRLESPGIMGFRGGIEELTRNHPSLRLRPVQDAVIHPGAAADWTLLVQFKGTRPGSFRSSGMRLHWDGGWHDYDYTLGLEAIG
jgi:hypothetical protein